MRLILSALAIVLMLTAPAAAQSVVIPAADWLSAMLNFVVLVVGLFASPFVLWVIGKLPPSIQSYISREHREAAEQLLKYGADWAVNATKGATKDTKFDVPLGNAAVAAGVQYVIDNGPKNIIKWLGGPEGIAQRIANRLEWQADVSAAEVAKSVTLPTQPGI